MHAVKLVTRSARRSTDGVWTLEMDLYSVNDGGCIHGTAIEIHNSSLTLASQIADTLETKRFQKGD